MTAQGWAVVGGLCTVILAFVGVYSVSQVARGQARAQAQTLAQQREQTRKDAYADGVQSQAYLITLLTSQRDDARLARDRLQARADNFERMYNDLRDQRTRRNESDRVDRRDAQERRDNDDRRENQ